jgi:glutamate racemase
MDDFCFFATMIGVFDSWLGGLQSLQYICDYLPECDFLYLGDTLYVPYGEKSEQRIHDRTFVCLQWLFDQWCILVILACNTASAYAIRDRQIRYPERKVLSVTVPGVEAIVHWWFHAPLLLGTKVTLETHIYESVREKAFPEYPVTWYVQIGTGRVQAIESWENTQQLQEIVNACHLERFLWKIDSVVLWCTHYPLLREQIATVLPGLPIIDPAAESALQLVDYLNRHPELEHKIDKNATIRYAVTGNSTHFDDLVEKVFKEIVKSEHVLLVE